MRDETPRASPASWLAHGGASRATGATESLRAVRSFASLTPEDLAHRSFAPLTRFRAPVASIGRLS